MLTTQTPILKNRRFLTEDGSDVSLLSAKPQGAHAHYRQKKLRAYKQCPLKRVLSRQAITQTRRPLSKHPLVYNSNKSIF